MNKLKAALEIAEEIGVTVINAKTRGDANRIAIHLLNPDLQALENAILQAERDNFSMIVCHSNATFAGGRKGAEMPKVGDA